MSGFIIGPKETSCPWCGKQFTIWRNTTGRWQAICSNSYCTIAPFAEHDTRENLVKALGDRVMGRLFEKGLFDKALKTKEIL